MQRKIIFVGLIYNILLAVIGKSFKPRFDSRSTIVILDSGIDLSRIDKRYLCNTGMLDFTRKGFKSKIEHGNLTFLAIQKIIDHKKTCIYPVKTIARNPNLSAENYLKALIFLVDWQFEKIVLPFEDISYWHKEVDLLDQISGYSKIYASAGNGQEILSPQSCNIYPACLSLKINNDNFIVVGSRYQRFNKGEVVTRLEDDEFNGIMGTSFSAAIAAAKDER